MAHLQHIDYVDLLNKLGANVIELPAEPSLPDSVFVEDTVLLFDELAVMTRPGATKPAWRSGQHRGRIQKIP